MPLRPAAALVPLRMRSPTARPAPARSGADPCALPTGAVPFAAMRPHLLGALALDLGLAMTSAALASCATSSAIVDTRTGTAVRIEAVADAMADKEVVFLGENHDSDVGHRLQFELVQLLHARRQELVVSMEMFERDVQKDLDAYLAGDLDEKTFLERTRPWKNYRAHYRPIVEYCKSHGLRVIAANLPRDLAAKVAHDGPDAVAGNANAARSTTAPKDAYWQRFAKTMAGDDAARSADWVFRFYQAQCFKDDTMAESIVDHWRAARARGEWPLVVHLCGRFHCDWGEGTAARVQLRDSSLRLGIVTMKGMPVVDPARLGDEDLRSGNFVLAVRSAEADDDDSAKAPAHGPPAHGAPAPAPAEPAPKAESDAAAAGAPKPAGESAAKGPGASASEPAPDRPRS